MPKKFNIWVLNALLLCLWSVPVHAVQRLTTARIRAPRNQGKKAQTIPKSPTTQYQEPWETRTPQRAMRKDYDIFPWGRDKPSREVPTFYGDPHQRIWNAQPTFGAALAPHQQTGVRNQPRPSLTEPMFGPGGLKGWLRTQIKQDRSKRYYEKLQGLQMLEQYRAEKSMLGLCPVDNCEKVRFVLEGKAFADEGYCEEHSREFYGNRVDWAMKSVRGRTERRAARARKFQKNWHTGGRFNKSFTPGIGPSVAQAQTSRNEIRHAVGQISLPKAFPKPGDLGPNGTLPLKADPRDPAGFPYNTVDPEPEKFERPIVKEMRSWVDVSEEAP